MTWFEYNNYGTALQVVALNKVLTDSDSVVSVIDYKTNPSTSWILLGTKNIKSVTLAYRKILKHNSNPFTSKLSENLFVAFKKKQLSFTRQCDSTAKLEELNNDFDCFVCGSDQIWAPSCFDKHYFLDFVTDPHKMIAYAPSLSLPNIGNKYIEKKIKNLTARFEHLSTREKNGADIISKLTGKNVEVVLDPTLLLNKNEWDEIVPVDDDNFKSSDYILVYLLGNNKKHWHTIKKISSSLNLKLKVIPVFEDDLMRDGCIKEPIGPEEFIKLIRNAEFVCTDSFHGLIFSVIYQKDFCAFKRFGKFDPVNQNSRVLELLEKLGLKSRIYKTGFNEFSKRIDYNSVNGLLNSLIDSSLKYLTASLNSVREYINTQTDKNDNSVNRFSEFCTGCGICTAVCEKEAIKIIRNDDGFFVADVNENSCIHCGKCKKICPLLNCETTAKIAEGKLYSYKDNRNEILMTSASGGFAYKASEYALENGYTVTGCTFDTEKQEALHISIKNKTELKLLQSSKYLQSFLPNVFPDIFDKEKKFFSFGLPCQIAALRNYRKDNNTVYVDLICYGVPSYNLYIKYKDWLSNKYNMNTKALDINFRYKPKGWRERYMWVSDNNKTIITSQKKDPYYLFFENRLGYSKVCYECPWRDKSAADIRIGDYWGPRFANDKTGVSLVCSLTKTGDIIISDLLSESRASFTKAEISDYLDWQGISNIPEPAESEETTNQLKNMSISLEKTVNSTLKPVERIRKLKKVYRIIKEKLK